MAGARACVSPRATKVIALLSLKSLIMTCAISTIAVSAAAALQVSASSGRRVSRLRGGGEKPTLLVVGSINADIVVPVDRFPGKGETVLARNTEEAGKMFTGGKGANQAVAVCRLGAISRFVCQFGNDAHAAALEKDLLDNGVDLSSCGRADRPSGQGIVLLEDSGAVSSIVVRGSNYAWPEGASYAEALKGVKAVLLQREVPEYVNEEVADAACAAGIPVFQDVGGEDRPISDKLLGRVDYVCPNESELARLTGKPTKTQEEVIAAAQSLVKRGAKNVLVTLGASGSVLVGSDQVLVQAPCSPPPPGNVVDETGAGDAFRAAFAVGFAEGRTVQSCLELASAAGAIAVSRMGAVPSLPHREECDALCTVSAKSTPLIGLRGGGGGHANSVNKGESGGLACCESGKSLDGCGSGYAATGQGAPLAGPERGLRGASDGVKTREACVPMRSELSTDVETCRLLPMRYAEDCRSPNLRGGAGSDPNFPLEFGSRLNSMKDRPDLWSGKNDVWGWVERQSGVEGLGLVDFNFPQHLEGRDVEDAKTCLSAHGLRAGAICMRFPKEMQAGAYTHPKEEMRKRAIALTIEGGRVAEALGAKELVIWSAYCGYDYHFQADHAVMWTRVVQAFQQVCDACPSLKVSLEFKPTDENTRFFAVPTTGAAVLLVREVSRENMGLTLDFGHLLMCGENPAQSVSMVGDKLFGIQLNDGYGRGEDGLMFGSVHTHMALELVYWLQRVKFAGHVYFDTFPRNEDPVRECEYNIKMFKSLWMKAEKLRESGMDDIMQRQDALAALELVTAML